MVLDQTIDSLPRTSPLTIKRLSGLGIKTYFDLLNYFPFRYENYSVVSKIAKLQEGETVTVIGTIESAKNNYLRRGFTIQKVVLVDETGKIELVWYNQPYLIRLFQGAKYLAISGNVKKGRILQLFPKEYEILQTPNQERLHTGNFVPVYPEKRGLSSRTLREKIKLVLGGGVPQLEIIPKELVKKNKLIPEQEAYLNIHFPINSEDAERARKRLSFDELFTIQLSSLLVKERWKKEVVGHLFEVKKIKPQLDNFIKSLPFKLTKSQEKVISDILDDLSSPHPMNRFLQGDVGSGKTVVAALAAYASYLNGFQTLFMAPTEILVNQHFNTLTSLLGSLKLKVALQTSGSKTENLNRYDVVVGTHALLNQKLNFKKVGLVVVDEQHRFGVKQRSILKAKGINPHLLTMTATPIPRTVALTLYGELDISVLDEMPKGRIPIKTFVVPKNKREDMYKWIKEKIGKEKIQAYIVCPLIDESEKETMQSVKAAKKEFDFLSKEAFKDFKVGLLHGRMKNTEKAEMMRDFKNNKINILVCTSVVEVGIDIPNATIMVIEGAERYGLAQLHQLRGRVGRGKDQSYCLLFAEKASQGAIARLKFFAQNNKGAEIAKFDLQTRGAGEIFGTRQHGVFELQIADLTNYELLEKSRKAVIEFNKSYQLEDYPLLKKKIDEYNVEQIARD